MAYTFDSIGDPIFVHDPEFRILRINQPSETPRPRFSALIGRTVTDLLPHKGIKYSIALIVKASQERETIQTLGSRIFPGLQFDIHRSARAAAGDCTCLEDISERQARRRKIPDAGVERSRGVFISNPQGRFMDFNDALMRILGFEDATSCCMPTFQRCS